MHYRSQLLINIKVNKMIMYWFLQYVQGLQVIYEMLDVLLLQCPEQGLGFMFLLELHYFKTALSFNLHLIRYVFFWSCQSNMTKRYVIKIFPYLQFAQRPYKLHLAHGELFPTERATHEKPQRRLIMEDMPEMAKYVYQFYMETIKAMQKGMVRKN